MIQIIDQAQKKPKFLDQLLSGVQKTATEGIPQIAQSLMGQRQMRGENQQIQKLIGQDLSGIQDPKMRQQIVQNLLKSKGQSGQYEAGLQTVQRMREIGKKGHLGIGSSIQGAFLGEARKDRGEYEQLGKSLISLASTIPIRNKVEFETLAHNLYDPSLSDEKREGILNAMEQIISQHLGSQGGSNQMMNEPKKERPPLSSFKR